MSNETEIKIEGVNDAITQAAQSVVAPQAGGAAKVGKRSFLQSDKAKYAGKVQIDDGGGGTETFYFNRLSDEVFEIADAVPEKIKTVMADNDLSAAQKQKCREGLELEAVDAVVVDALRSWTLDAPCTDENKRDLHLDVKSLLAERIASFSRFGESEANFHRRLGNNAS